MDSHYCYNLRELHSTQMLSTQELTLNGVKDKFKNIESN